MVSMRWMMFVLFSSMVWLSGCGEQTSGTDRTDLGIKPPAVSVAVGGEMFNAVQGSYCWNTKHSGTCVDMIAYEELVEKQDAHPRAFSGDAVELGFVAHPDELTVMASFPDSERPDEAIHVEDGRFRLAAGAGTHIYIIHAEWPQGRPDYVFRVHVLPR